MKGESTNGTQRGILFACLCFAVCGENLSGTVTVATCYLVFIKTHRQCNRGKYSVNCVLLCSAMCKYYSSAETNGPHGHLELIAGEAGGKGE